MENIIVIKIGGVASDNLTATFYQQLARWQKLGKKIVIVHGGGHYITSMMARLNVELTIKNGVRVTTAATLEIVKMILLGQVQPSLTTALSSQGFLTTGLAATDQQLLIGVPKNTRELGLVGEVTDVNVSLLHNLLTQEVIPVIAPLAISETGQWLNVNADQTACAIASALNAQKLYLLTDVRGISYQNQLLSHPSLTFIKQMKREGALFGGMLPKVESAVTALKNGVKEIHITNQLAPGGTILSQAQEVSR